MKYIFACLSCLLSFTACTSDFGEYLHEHNGDRVVINVEPYTYDKNGTRTVLTYSDNSIKFRWNDTETIGIFPAYPVLGSQAYKRLKFDKESDGHVAVFDGGGWKLEPGNYYVACYPYNASLSSDATHEEIPMDISGQVLDGYNSLTHIGRKYDYMCAFAKAPDEGDIVFNFKHLTSIIQLNVAMPVYGTIDSVIISDVQGENVFVEKAIYDGYTMKMTPTKKTSSIKLKVDKATSVSGVVSLYFCVLNMPGRPVDITVKLKDGGYMKSTYTPENARRGYAYRWNIEPCQESRMKEIAEGDSCVDLGLSVKWAIMNVGAKLPEEQGGAYAWGETTTKNRDEYGFKTYKFYNKEKSRMSKYAVEGRYLDYDRDGNPIDGDPARKAYYDNLTTLLPEDDAATQNWGKQWRMPTADECNELFENCECHWVENYLGSGVDGAIFVAKNGNSIFLPQFQAHMSRGSTIFPEPGVKYPTTDYWSSSLSEDDNFHALDYGVSYHDSKMIGPEVTDGNDRFDGCAVRAVRVK